MPLILKQFLSYLTEKRNYSDKTIAAYSKDLMLFFDFIKEYLEIKVEVKDFNVFILGTVQEETIYAFLVYLNYYRDNTAISRQRRLACLKSFFKWLYCIKEPSFAFKQNPLKTIPSIPKMFRFPKYLNLEQAKKIQNIFDSTNSRYPERNNAIITVFLHTGIRISELVNLSISKIDFENKKTHIIAKGNVEREIFFNEYTINKINQYLNTRNDNNDALFLSSRNKRISIDAVEDICKKAFTLIGIENTTKYCAHTLRHTAATIMYKKTDLLITKIFLGHKSVSSTEIYSHIDNEDIKNAIMKNPLSNFNI